MNLIYDGEVWEGVYRVAAPGDGDSIINDSATRSYHHKKLSSQSSQKMGIWSRYDDTSAQDHLDQYFDDSPLLDFSAMLLITHRHHHPQR